MLAHLPKPIINNKTNKIINSLIPIEDINDI